METLSARVEPFPGSERALASTLEGLGFQVFRVDGTFTVRAPPEVWHRYFDGPDLLSRELVVPEELTDMVTRIVLLRSRSDTESSRLSGKPEP